MCEAVSPSGHQEQEALLVLGAWLHSLRTGRLRITWAYTVGADGFGENGAGIAELCRTHDLAIRRTGAIEEGVPGDHGTEVFRVPSGPLGDDPGKALGERGGAGAGPQRVPAGWCAAAWSMRALRGRADDPRSVAGPGVTSRTLATRPVWSPNSAGPVRAYAERRRFGTRPRRGSSLDLTIASCGTRSREQQGSPGSRLLV